MLYSLAFTFLVFIICSFIGKIGEVVLCSAMHKKFVNRGFLMGPYVPIWGIGALILGPALNIFKSNLIEVFFAGMIIGSIIEFTISYILEKIYNARWWHYSTEFLSINGRVCLSSSITFGIAGLIYLYLFYPHLEVLLNFINRDLLIKISEVIFIVFIIDVIISGIFIYYLKKKNKLKGEDCTESVKKEIRRVLFGR